MVMLRTLETDETLAWDRERARTTGSYDNSTVREAEQRFERNQARGGTALKKVAGEGYKRAESFDPLADEILLLPRVAGG